MERGGGEEYNTATMNGWELQEGRREIYTYRTLGRKNGLTERLRGGGKQETEQWNKKWIGGVK